MKQKLPAGVIVAVIVVVVIALAYFGWRTLSGGPNADITQEKINFYDAQVKARQAHKISSPQEAAKAGAPMMPNAMPPGGAAPGGGSR